MDEIKLKPCPFCGCTRVWMRAVEYDKCINIIRCPDCNMEFTTPTMKEGWKFNNRKQTADIWNRRICNQNADNMKLHEVIMQLESLRSDRESFLTGNDDDIYKADIEALDFAIDQLRGKSGTGTLEQ
ncbi:MAG: Lar family restriction alleviation protein [Ruminococcus sp.]|nr:Lar family restriction alleviation protein [Ruminococcus sp.]